MGGIEVSKWSAVQSMSRKAGRGLVSRILVSQIFSRAEHRRDTPRSRQVPGIVLGSQGKQARNTEAGGFL